MRLFLAAPVDRALRERAEAALAPLRERAPKVRWTPASRWHLTLKFLGELDREKAEALASSLAARLEGQPTSSLTPSGLHLFPGPRRPRVVALAFEPPPGDLLALHRVLEALAAGVGVLPEERPFRPHLTLGRIRHPRDARPLQALLPALEGEAWPALPVERVQLVHSVLGRAGPAYTLLAEAHLRPALAQR
ncbi:MAG: RNA 2',3'-cyclic phosphodiesterase [Deltaproteobacteria bacterium]|nr:RNA 2',3'-cyclic phosphodiesterase [Deltaproteobacteria bacterium]